nr:MAG TPA: hypothetical protein [Caudoviricetes sp.]
MLIIIYYIIKSIKRCTTKDNKRYSNYNFNVKLVRCFNYDTLLLS